MQPPPRGCVLKPKLTALREFETQAAAFARLCVETARTMQSILRNAQPPPRGCVLKLGERTKNRA